MTSDSIRSESTIAVLACAIGSILLTALIFNFQEVFSYFNSPMGRLELIASVLLLINVYLLTKQKLSNYFYGLGGVLIFGYIFREFELYSDMWLQWAFYVPLQIIGFVIWMWGPSISDWYRNKFQNAGLVIRPVDSMKIAVMSWSMRIVAVVGIVVAMFLWVPHMIAAGASFPVADAFIMWLSIAASIMMLWKYLENWLLWITVDLIAIPVYWSKGLHITSGLYVIFLCLATYGLWKWWIEYKDNLPVRTGQSAWIP